MAFPFQIFFVRAQCGVLQGVLVHWGRVGDKCSISLCAVSLKIFNGGNRCSGRGEALAVRADGRFRHLGKADVASGANDGAIGAADVAVEGQDELGRAGGIGACQSLGGEGTKLRNLAWSEVLPPER